MPRAPLPRVQRLEQLQGLLRARDHVTAGELASELGVSLRTLNRDLEVLRETGVLIESDRGRGGGLRLHRASSLGRVHLNAAEAIDLLLSLAIAERMGSPLLLQHLSPIRRKIAAAFGDNHHSRIRTLRTRILIGQPASSRVTASFVQPPRHALSQVAEAFVDMRSISITYADRSGALTSRDVEPHYLYLGVPVWYLLTWDRARQAVRSFRVDRIRSIVGLGPPFRLRDPAPYLADVESGVARL